MRAGDQACRGCTRCTVSGVAWRRGCTTRLQRPRSAASPLPSRSLFKRTNASTASHPIGGPTSTDEHAIPRTAACRPSSFWTRCRWRTRTRPTPRTRTPTTPPRATECAWCCTASASAWACRGTRRRLGREGRQGRRGRAAAPRRPSRGQGVRCAELQAGAGGWRLWSFEAGDAEKVAAPSLPGLCQAAGAAEAQRCHVRRCLRAVRSMHHAGERRTTPCVEWGWLCIQRLPGRLQPAAVAAPHRPCAWRAWPGGLSARHSASSGLQLDACRPPADVFGTEDWGHAALVRHSCGLWAAAGGCGGTAADWGWGFGRGMGRLRGAGAQV